MSELFFLRINTEEVMNISNEIAHMHNPFKVICEESDTHYDLFKKLRERVKDKFSKNEDAKSACDAWIKLNEDDLSTEQLQKPIVSGWDDYAGETFYVWFDMKTIG